MLHDYDPASGRVEGILTDNGAMQDLAYGYDSLGNLRWRRDRAQDIREDFDYDVLNRLTGVTTDDRVSSYRRDFSCDALGNLLSKDGLSYSYGGSGGPQAVSQTLGEVPSYIFSNGFECQWVGVEFSQVCSPSRVRIPASPPLHITRCFQAGILWFSFFTRYLGGQSSLSSLPPYSCTLSCPRMVRDFVFLGILTWESPRVKGCSFT